MSSQDKIVYQLKQEYASLRGDVELLISENEHLRSQSSPINREEGMHLLFATLKNPPKSLHVHVILEMTILQSTNIVVSLNKLNL